MFYGQYIDTLLSRLGLEIRDENKRAIAGAKINAAYTEIANTTDINWEYMKRYGEIVTIPNYTTGSCTITMSSNIVTFAGSTLTADMEGRFFQPQGSPNWYQISKVLSSSQCVLLSPIIEATASGLTFIIWKRWYYASTEVLRILDMGSWIRDGVVTERSSQWITERNSNISNTGDPIEFSMYGSTSFDKEYSTGNQITTVKDSNVMTGVGTAWLSNVEAGDIVQISTQTYRVKRVNSDTEIILLNRATADVTSDNYLIKNEANVGFQLWWNPNQSVLIPYYYRKYAYDMVNETYDRPELPEKFKLAILDLAEASYLDSELNNKTASGAKLSLASARIKDLKADNFTGHPKYRQMRPEVPDDRGGYFNA